MNLICHRIPDRTFQIKGKYFPICARCTGVYTTLFIYYVAAAFIPITYSLNLLTMGILTIIPAAADGITQLYGLRESRNSLRFITGLLAGFGIGIVVKTIKFTFLV